MPARNPGFFKFSICSLSAKGFSSHFWTQKWFFVLWRACNRLHNRRSRLLGGEPCVEPAISLHSHHVWLVQWTTRLLPITRDPCSKPLGELRWNRDSPVSVVSLQCFIYCSSPTFLRRQARLLKQQSSINIYSLLPRSETSVFRFRLQQTNRSLPFPLSVANKRKLPFSVTVFRKYRFPLVPFSVWGILETWRHGHGDMEMETWKYGDKKKIRGDLETWAWKHITQNGSPGDFP
jgi:hypothetical protein